VKINNHNLNNNSNEDNSKLNNFIDSLEVSQMRSQTSELRDYISRETFMATTRGPAGEEDGRPKPPSPPPGGNGQRPTNTLGEGSRPIMPSRPGGEGGQRPTPIIQPKPPFPPPDTITTSAMGEEDGGGLPHPCPPPEDTITTSAMGEEGGCPTIPKPPSPPPGGNGQRPTNTLGEGSRPGIPGERGGGGGQRPNWNGRPPQLPRYTTQIIGEDDKRLISPDQDIFRNLPFPD
jgi:hypothetical protein